MKDCKKKDIITIIVITLVLFLITELYVAFYDGIFIIVNNEIIFGIFLAVLVSIIIFSVCKKFNIKIKKNKINSAIFWVIIVLIIIYRFTMLGYVEYKMDSICEMSVNLDNNADFANNFRELLDILKLTQEEEEILNKNKDEDVIYKLSKIDSSLKRGIMLICTYDAWKLVNVDRAVAIQNIWNAGSFYGFGYDGYKKFIKENGYQWSNYGEITQKAKKMVNESVPNIIIIPTICEIIISFILIKFISKED